MLKATGGNSKLRKTSKKVKAHLQEHGSLAGFIPRKGAYRVFSFNIPAGGYELDGKKYITCPGAGACRKICYAGQGTFLFKGSVKLRIDNHQTLLALHKKGGHKAVVEALQAVVDRLPKTVAVLRLHDSGDFFKLWYLTAWLEVARNNPGILFYCYTKSIPFFVGLGKEKPFNFRLTQSNGGIFDHLIQGANSKIFETEEERIQAGYVDGNDSDMPSILNEENIGLVYHGVKNPSKEDFDALR